MSRFYNLGFEHGKTDRPYRPPKDPGDQYEYLNGYLDATKDKRINIRHIDNEQSAHASSQSEEENGFKRSLLKLSKVS